VQYVRDFMKGPLDAAFHSENTLMVSVRRRAAARTCAMQQDHESSPRDLPICIGGEPHDNATHPRAHAVVGAKQAMSQSGHYCPPLLWVPRGMTLTSLVVRDARVLCVPVVLGRAACLYDLNKDSVKGPSR
jgi:hypothetical protein